MFRALDSPFESLLTRPVPRPSQLPASVLPQDVHHIQATITRPCTSPRAFARWFKVPKSDRPARLGQNLGTLSAFMWRAPLSCRRFTPSSPEPFRRRGVAADLQNWFYQIPIPPEWWPWFCAHIAASRGEFHQVCLTILFVGLGISTYIDHFLALAIARLALPTSPSSAGSWVDNLYWVGTSRADECDQEPSPGVAEFCLVLSPHHSHLLC
jgi:hypothetical protein